MLKKATIFSALVFLFIVYLTYEYYRFWTYQNTTYLDMTSVDDFYSFAFTKSSDTPATTIGASSNKNGHNLLDAKYLESFKDDLKLSLGDVAEYNDAIMPFMPNTTARAELGQATWRLLHTMATRFPREPTPSEQASFELFVLLISRLYPCGNCAKHFQAILKSKPPNFPSRDAAVQWMCETHNIVNKRLEKKQFDCSKAAEAWKCGCADEYLKEMEEAGKSESATATATSQVATKTK